MVEDQISTCRRLIIQHELAVHELEGFSVKIHVLTEEGRLEILESQTRLLEDYEALKKNLLERKPSDQIELWKAEDFSNIS